MAAYIPPHYGFDAERYAQVNDELRRTAERVVEAIQNQRFELTRERARLDSPGAPSSACSRYDQGSVHTPQRKDHPVSILLYLFAAILLPFTLSLPLITGQQNPVRMYSVTLTPTSADTVRLQAKWEKTYKPGSGVCVSLYEAGETLWLKYQWHGCLGSDDGPEGVLLPAPGFDPAWQPLAISVTAEPLEHTHDSDYNCRATFYYSPPLTSSPGPVNTWVILPELAQPVGEGLILTLPLRPGPTCGLEWATAH